MSFDQIVVLIGGIALIVFVFWFFFMKKERAVTAADSIDILVQGGYTPETITIARGKPTTLKFTRKDASSCLEEVVLSDFNIKKYLPLNETVSIIINPGQAGEYKFSCGMSMFHGKLIVR